jgi:hypothetical protein
LRAGRDGHDERPQIVFIRLLGLNPPGKHANVSTHDEANTVFAGKSNDRIAG